MYSKYTASGALKRPPAAHLGSPAPSIREQPAARTTRSDHSADWQRMQSRIDALEAQVELDRDQITRLRAELAGGRKRIERMLTDALFDTMKIDRLAAARAADRAEFERQLLEAKQMGAA